MQHDVVQVRNQPLFAHRKQPYSIPETVIVTCQFLFARSEQRVIPVAEKLNHEPEDQYAKQDPPTGRDKQIVCRQTEAVQTKHDKLSAFDPHPFDQKLLSDPVGRNTA